MVEQDARAGSVANLWIEPGGLLRGGVPERVMAEAARAPLENAPMMIFEARGIGPVPFNLKEQTHGQAKS